MNNQFRTKIPSSLKDALITHDSVVLSIGSCFSSNIGRRLSDLLYDVNINPFGVLYHPSTIERTILYGLGVKKFTEEQLTLSQDIWYSWDHHGQYSNEDKGVLLSQISESIKALNVHLSKTTVCLITLGSAWGYEWVETGYLVANCHKHPGTKFQKRLISPVHIEASLQNIVRQLKAVNENMTVIFTVSPVRHIKDGFVENQLSKSSLILAVHKCISSHSNCWYFPAYEIMMDDLRDYRFYDRDMLHPNETAIGYIWGLFEEAYMSGAQRATNQEIVEFRSAALHKPFHPHSQAHQQFVRAQVDRLSMFGERHSEIDIQSLMDLFRSQLINYDSQV